MTRKTVHPRWRGEQLIHWLISLHSAGSSPLARGTGKPSELAVRQPPVHPRWRGEQAASRARDTAESGSSPLARGTGGDGCSEFRYQRFIPAGAGNSGSAPRSELTLEVHPRWRGEQNDGSCVGAGATGSSPLARGTGNDCCTHRRVVRFIPAGAGNSGSFISR